MRIVIDSTLEVGENLREFIRIVPLKVTIGEESYRDGEIKLEEMFDKVRKTGNFPKTSQPSPADFERVYSEILEEGEDWILSIHITEGLSGTVSSARMAAKNFKGKVWVVDTGSASIIGHLFVKRALEMKDERPERVVEELEDLRKRSAVYLTVGNLEFLKRSGRLKGIEALIGSIMRLRPLMESKLGYLKPKKIYRSASRVLKAMKEIMRGAKEVVIGHILAPEPAKELADFAKSLGLDHEIVEVRSSSLSAHLGPGSYGIAVRT